jgi:hypothetical protein
MATHYTGEDMANKPTHKAYTVRDYEKDGKKDSYWMEIGVAFLHKDGKGFDAALSALPVDGRIVFRLNEEKKKAPPED